MNLIISSAAIFQSFSSGSWIDVYSLLTLLSNQYQGAKDCRVICDDSLKYFY